MNSIRKTVLAALALALISTGLNAQENPIAQISKNPGWKKLQFLHYWSKESLFLSSV